MSYYLHQLSDYNQSRVLFMPKLKRDANNMDMVVKSNRIITALQNLSLAEMRLIQLAIVDAREKEQGLEVNKPLVISAKRYADAFGVQTDTAYKVLAEAGSTLRKRGFKFISERQNEVETNWVQQIEYVKDSGKLEVIFTIAVVDEITRLEKHFTQYALECIATLNSIYSVRLYELIIKWYSVKKTDVFDYEILRGQLGIGVNEYQAMCDFKRRVLNLAVKEINEKTDIKIDYEQVKEGRKITGFIFNVKKKPKPAKVGGVEVQEFKPMTEKQINTFGAKLAKDSAFGSKHAKSGESQKAFELRIKQALSKHENQKLWAVHLEKVGYKTTSHGA